MRAKINKTCALQFHANDRLTEDIGRMMSFDKSVKGALFFVELNEYHLYENGRFCQQRTWPLSTHKAQLLIDAGCLGSVSKTC